MEEEKKEREETIEKETIETETVAKETETVAKETVEAETVKTEPELGKAAEKKDEPKTITADVIEAEPTAQVEIADAKKDLSEIEVKNPRIGKVLKLQEETERQQELEQLRSKRIRQEQEYIDRMLQSVEQTLKNTKEEQRKNLNSISGWRSTRCTASVRINCRE